MQIAVISDLHLGPGDTSDCFGHEDADFERFLRRLESDFDQIVLLGDIWETLTSERPYSPVEGLRRAKEAHPALARRFENARYLYVHGNHDLIAQSTDCARAEALIDCGDQRLLFTHGHHHDWLIRRARWLSECGVWLGGWAQRLRMSAVYRVGYSIEAWLSRPTLGPRLDSFQRWALSLANQRGADVVVTGHTHVPQRQDHQGIVYLNSGSCSQGAFSYLAMDTRERRYVALAA
jgi:predicted phosphodiesterase